MKLGRLIGVWVTAVLLLLPGSPAFTQVAVDWPSIFLTRVAGGLFLPVQITHAGDGSGRLFVIEQTGLIRIVRNGALLAAPFLDITGRVQSGGERGLLSVAFPPQFTIKRHFYVYYTNLSGNIVVARYSVTANPDIADPASEQVILTIDHSPFANHNGGQLAFGPEGYLYLGTGDGGGGGDPFGNGQNPGARLGKVLRIDVESGTSPYALPPSNPFLGVPGFLPEIWALGLRNPWRFSFDRLTGDLYIADVGQNLFEEVNFQPVSSAGGENYGWNMMEGFHCFNVSNPNIPLPQCNQSGFVLPVTEYDHSLGCSITGGMVYRGPGFPRMQGVYFYGDFCTGRIWGLKRAGAAWQSVVLLDTALSISSFGEDQAGNLYVADYATGDIHRIAEIIPIMPLPAGVQSFAYPQTTTPVKSDNPAAARPIGVGPVSLRNHQLTLRVSLEQFAGPVDIYGAFVSSADPTRVNVFRSNVSFMPLQTLPTDTVDGVLTSGSVEPWRRNVAGPLNTVFRFISHFSPGTYQVHLLVTPAGRVDSYYFWTTSLVVP